MKKEEEMAKIYLEHLGYRDIVFEPDGNIPPDFLLNRGIAVEVRRFNQYFRNDNSMEALEDLGHKLVPTITSILSEYKHIQTSHSVYVFIDFERPLKPSKSLYDEVRITLNKYLSDFGNRVNLKVNEKLTLQIYPVEERLSSPFVFGGSGDGDSGGFVVANVHAHLPFVISEKEKKIKPFFQKYPTWWLVLIDTIGYGLDQYDLDQLNKNPPYKTIFDKVILVSPNNLSHGSEVSIEKHSYET
ncbi:MAG: hypothetical protein H6565_02855 [Lewinellaceae bacterium]|nr:hypothetical protein [Lewinellaceae bacterium]